MATPTIKITHYLNKKLKPINWGIENEDFFPVYVRVLYGREVMRFRSPAFNTGDNVFDYFSDEQLKSEKTQNKIINETTLIKFILTNFDKLDQSLSIVENINILNHSIIELFELDFWITYFNQNSDGTGGINYFDYINEYVCELLETKTDIQSKFFLSKGIMNNLNTYIYLDDSVSDYIPNHKLKTMFLIGKRIAEFNKSYFSEKKKFNIYEWCFNSGKSKFLEFVKSDLKKIDNKILSYIIEGIDFNCEIRLFPYREIEY